MSLWKYGTMGVKGPDEDEDIFGPACFQQRKGEFIDIFRCGDGHPIPALISFEMWFPLLVLKKDLTPPLSYVLILIQFN